MTQNVLAKILSFYIFQFIMYQMKFDDLKTNKIITISKTLECKGFSKQLYQLPSDRHAYSAKFFATPVRYLKKLVILVYFL